MESQRRLGCCRGGVLVTITIGGNDAGFGTVIINCALYYFTCGSAIKGANEFIDKNYPRCWTRRTTTFARGQPPPVLSCSDIRTCSHPRAKPATATS
jgi:hypothetical protein